MFEGVRKKNYETGNNFKSTKKSLWVVFESCQKSKYFLLETLSFWKSYINLDVVPKQDFRNIRFET